MADLAVGAATRATETDFPAPQRGPRRGRVTPASLGLRTVALLYVALLVLVPVVTLFYRTFQHGLGDFFGSLHDERVAHAFQVTGIVAGWSVLINTVFGVAVALVMARHRFPGKRLLSALIDLPVAVSPIVVGLALVLVFGYGGLFGNTFTDGPIHVIGAKTGMVLATVFVSLPLVVRAVLPVLEHAGNDQELAAASLGAGPLTVFWRITLPTIRAALTYGVVLSVARCIGEYGAVLVVSGNILGQTETAPLFIDNEITQELNFPAAYSVALVLVLIALLAIVISAYIRRRQAH